MKTCRLLLFGLLLLLGNMARAEGNCPRGYYPIGAPQGQAGPQSCAPIPRYGNGQQQQRSQQSPPPQWASRWGAIATDSAKGILGVTTDQPSESGAQQSAMADCQTKGGASCKLEIAYDNECVTLAVGSKGYSINTGNTPDAANQLAMKTCSAYGEDHDCHVYYSACSLPVRTQ